MSGAGILADGWLRVFRGRAGTLLTDGGSCGRAITSAAGRKDWGVLAFSRREDASGRLARRYALGLRPSTLSATGSSPPAEPVELASTTANGKPGALEGRRRALADHRRTGNPKSNPGTTVARLTSDGRCVTRCRVCRRAVHAGAALATARPSVQTEAIVVAGPSGILLAGVSRRSFGAQPRVPANPPATA